MWLFIQPNDAIFLRDGRAFDAGGNLYAGNLFPPYPSGCYSMIRTLLVHQVSTTVDYSKNNFFNAVPEEYKALLGNIDQKGNLSVKGPLIGKKDDAISLYIPAPADLYYKKPEDIKDDVDWYLLQPKKDHLLNDFSDLDMPFLESGFSNDALHKELKPAEYYLAGGALKKYLEGQTSNSHLMTAPINQNDITAKLWVSEPSTIIEREDSNLTAKKHQLAYPEFTRMKEDTGLVLQVSDDLASHFKDVHIARLGGENRMCHVSKGEIRPIVDTQKIIDRILDTGRFKVFLLTPGFFRHNGYYPDFLTPPSGYLPEGEWHVNGHTKKVRLITIAVQRVLRIGGWNLAKGVPKTMVKAVPAGTVYYFEMVDFAPNKDKDWITSLVQSAFPGTLPGDIDYCKQGFNTFFTGGWNYV